jgi:hypothetical protein
MSTLQNTIGNLATQFANGVLAAIRTASLEDILAESNGAPSKRGPGRPAKGASASTTASSGDAIGAITALLATKPEGLRAEQIRAALKLDKPTVTKALTKALASKAVKKQGQKRATTYFAR